MTKSTSVKIRIMTAFPNINKWKDYELVLSNLVSFFEGKKIRINEGWTHSRGHSSLLANAEGRHTLKVLKTANVSVQLGNDAPHGGAVGAYFKCLRKNANAAKFFRELLTEAKNKY